MCVHVRSNNPSYLLRRCCCMIIRRSLPRTDDNKEKEQARGRDVGCDVKERFVAGVGCVVIAVGKVSM